MATAVVGAVIALLAALAVLVALAVRQIWKEKLLGKCGGDCASCGAGCAKRRE